MILGYVDDVKDLRNCSKTCKLFERILEETKTQWLFGKIFPFLFNHLRRSEILKARRVCTTWSHEIDSFMEKYYTIVCPDRSPSLDLNEMERKLDQPNVTLKAFHFEYNFSIPPPPPEDLQSSSSSDSESVNSSQASINRNHDKVRHKMLLHSRNPFIGRSVTIEEDSSSFEVDENFEEGMEPPPINFVSEAAIFLKDFGRHIWHLSVCCNMNLQTAMDFYRVVNQSLIDCPNLRTLCLQAELNWSSTRERYRSIRTINAMPPFPPCPTLEAIQMDANDKMIYMIQDKLLENYSKQLRRVEVQLWNTNVYHTYQWSSLKELQISEAFDDNFLMKLMKIKAPNLRKLVLMPLKGGGPFLRILLLLTNHFPKLTHLELKFETRYGVLSQVELANIPAGLTCSPSLTTLEVSTSVTDMLSYSFLMCFPFLQRLLIRRGHWTNVNLPPASHLCDNAEKNKKELVKIVKYLKPNCEDVKMMYKSNLWEILPYLQVFELCNAKYVPEKKTVYTREGYEHFKKSAAAPSAPAN